MAALKLEDKDLSFLTKLMKKQEKLSNTGVILMGKLLQMKAELKDKK